MVLLKTTGPIAVLVSSLLGALHELDRAGESTHKPAVLLPSSRPSSIKTFRSSSATSWLSHRQAGWLCRHTLLLGTLNYLLYHILAISAPFGNALVAVFVVLRHGKSTAAPEPPPELTTCYTPAVCCWVRSALSERLLVDPYKASQVGSHYYQTR